MNNFTYGSVCSGYCAATLAWKPLGWVTKFFSEIEKFPSAVLAHHYGSNMPGEALSKNGIPNYGDFTKIEAGAGPIDLLVGGTPCQSFSVAGKRLGLDDPRGNLALEFLSLARRLGARWIVWENVPGVLSSRSDDGTHDFATFLDFVRECGYGFAYRVLDAQHVRVGRYAYAVPQRRRRVFVVGYLGDWRRAAAVLFDRESLRGDPAPRRQAGQGIAPTIASRPSGGGGLGTDFDLDGGLIANSGDVSYCLTVNGARSCDAETETMIAHALRGEGFDASEDGTGRGTPIVPVAPTLRAGGNSTGGNRPCGTDVDTCDSLIAEPMVLMERGRDGESSLEYRQDGTANAILTPNGGRGGFGVGAIAHAIQAGALRENPDAGPDGVGVQEGVSYTLEARAEVQAVSFAQNQRGELRTSDVAAQLTTGGGKPGEGYSAVALNATADVSPTIKRDYGKGYGDGELNAGGLVSSTWAVRRLTPTECERLQGVPDGFTLIPWRGKDAESCPDGPRYKALGNSMAVNVMALIGERIDAVERLSREGLI